MKDALTVLGILVGVFTLQISAGYLSLLIRDAVIWVLGAVL